MLFQFPVILSHLGLDILNTFKLFFPQCKRPCFIKQSILWMNSCTPVSCLFQGSQNDTFLLITLYCSFIISRTINPHAFLTAREALRIW